MRNGYALQPNLVFRALGTAWLTHALLVVPGGYFLDDEFAIACTVERNVNDAYVVSGVATCVLCWAAVFRDA